MNLIGEGSQVYGCSGATVLSDEQLWRRQDRAQTKETERSKLERNLDRDRCERPARILRQARRTRRNRLDGYQGNRRFGIELLQCYRDTGERLWQWAGWRAHRLRKRGADPRDEQRDQLPGRHGQRDRSGISG